MLKSKINNRLARLFLMVFLDFYFVIMSHNSNSLRLLIKYLLRIYVIEK